jgi:hypothetical protein
MVNKAHCRRIRVHMCTYTHYTVCATVTAAMFEHTNTRNHYKVHIVTPFINHVTPNSMHSCTCHHDTYLPLQQYIFDTMASPRHALLTAPCLL